MFLINIVLGSIGLVAGLMFLPRDEGNPGTSIDGLGSLLLAGIIFSFLYGLIEGSTYGWTGIPAVILSVGLGFFVLFCWRQQVAHHPLIEPSLLQNRGFTTGLLLGLVFFSVVSGLTYVISLFLLIG
jgi:hypothetical protein